MATNKSDPAAQQYAKALFMIGTEKQCIGQIYEEINSLTSAYRHDRVFRNFFTSPKVPAEAKLNVAFQALGNPGEVTRGFLTQLVRKGRELLLDNIMDAFAKYRDEAENKVHVFVESAQPLGATERENLVSALTSATKKSVMLAEVVRPELIGGLRIRVGDALIDNTLLTRLEGLKARLLELDRLPMASDSLQDAESLYARMSDA
jgi:F-type H+-transporting ATPase subunit delta